MLPACAQGATGPEPESSVATCAQAQAAEAPRCTTAWAAGICGPSSRWRPRSTCSQVGSGPQLRASSRTWERPLLSGWTAALLTGLCARRLTACSHAVAQPAGQRRPAVPANPARNASVSSSRWAGPGVGRRSQAPLPEEHSSAWHCQASPAWHMCGSQAMSRTPRPAPLH